MADTLIREAIAYGSQPLSPVPQYWDGSSYIKVQGINGAIRAILYNSAGETFTGASPGSVQLTATSTVAISGTSTISFSGTNTVEIVTSAGASALFSGVNPGSIQLTATSTIDFSATGTVEILSSAGGTAYFSGANPASIKLTATSTVNFSGSGTVIISGTSTVTFSGTETVIISGTSTINFSGSGTVAITGNVTVTGSLTADIAVMPVVGTQANAWSASATVTAGATSNVIDCQYTYNLSIFGTVDTTSVITIQISQDDTTYYNHSANITMTASGTFHRLFDSAARYAKLSIDTTATITATIAGK